ncbi:heat stress transcription factor A-4a [Raphanus sativus]|uniref:Heat stress transcription factor A-4a n=1 Tax=Raphanus sativus TaxID=3726 RepID=A0A6J0NM11_RAPSA|nr:heat stress transcription factor A-4a [Raphanus sativus]
MDRDSNDGRIPLSSLSCYKEMCRLADKDCHFSTIRRPPLLFRDVYEMVNDPSTDSVVSWGDSGKSFIVWKESEFLGDVLPRCLSYDYKDMTSFTTKFHALGYNKVEESVHWEYTANYLVRGQPPSPKDPSPCTSADLLTMVTPEYAKIYEWSFAYIKDRKQ